MRQNTTAPTAVRKQPAIFWWMADVRAARFCLYRLDHRLTGCRIQKLIESANIKLGQVATDVLGVSGRLMLRALADGEQDSEKLVALARGSLKEKKMELRRALTSRMTPAQRFVLTELLQRLAELEAATARVSKQIIKEVAESADPFVPEAVQLLQTIHGIALRVAEVIVSEISVDMTRFPTDAHLASWAGVCPGNNESAGRRRSGQTTKGSPYLGAAITREDSYSCFVAEQGRSTHSWNLFLLDLSGFVCLHVSLHYQQNDGPIRKLERVRYTACLIRWRLLAPPENNECVLSGPASINK